MREQIVSRCLTTADAAEWRRLLPASTSVFGSIGFLRLLEQTEGGQGCLFITESADGALARPFSLRPLPELNVRWEDPQPVDIASPPYAGPLLAGQASEELIAAHREAFSAFCRRRGVVAEFAHLHPWAARVEALDPADVRLDRSLIYVDTTLSDERLWSEHFARSCRKNVKRAANEGVEVVVAQGARQIADFRRVYADTMSRRDALEKYFFPTEYFERVAEELPDNSRFSLAIYRDQVVAGTLYLYDDLTVYSYLGGADHRFQHVRPTNQVVYDTIEWARRTGRERLLLGGGYRVGDGIERFKATFSKLRAPFSVYRKVHDRERYLRACEAWAEGSGSAAESEFFPAYRGPRPNTDKDSDA